MPGGHPAIGLVAARVAAFSEQTLARTIRHAAILTGALSLALSASHAAAQPEEPLDHARPRLVAEHHGAEPGATLTLGVSFEIDPGWHIYWIGLNDTGFPTTFDWTLPEGFEVGPIGWPVPKRYATPSIGVLDHIYEQRVTHLAPLRVPPDAEPGTIATVTVAVEWLVCREACIPGYEELSIEIPILEPGSEPRPSTGSGLIAAARAALPKPADAPESPVRLVWSREAALIEVAGADSVQFYPHETTAPLESPLRDGISEDNTLRLVLGDPDPEHPNLRGVVQAWDADRRPLGAWWIDRPVLSVETPKPAMPSRIGPTAETPSPRPRGG